jgi:hypothetical protein
MPWLVQSRPKCCISQAEVLHQPGSGFWHQTRLLLWLASNFLMLLAAQ